MNRQLLLLVALACILGAPSVQAQVVQLPTFSSFSVSTTVSVPDSGAGYLGGVSRGAWSSSSRGVPGLSHVPGLNRLFTNRSIGSSVSSSHAYATATIIDHDELDRMVLAEAAARRGEREFASEFVSEAARRAAFLSEFVARRPESPISSPAAAERGVASEVAARLASANAQHEAEMASYVQRAESAEAAGKFGAARCCYNVLARRGSDQQKRFAAQRLAALEAPRTDEKLASREDRSPVRSSGVR